MMKEKKLNLIGEPVFNKWKSIIAAKNLKKGHEYN